MAVLILLLLAALATLTSAQCGNVTIASQSDADIVRKNCPVVTNITVVGLPLDTPALILDGVKEITGTLHLLSNSGPNLTVSSDTLALVGVDLYSVADYGTLAFPALESVGRQVFVWGGLRALRLPALNRLGGLFLYAPNLTDVDLTGLERFNDVPATRGTSATSRVSGGTNRARSNGWEENLVAVASLGAASLDGIFSRRFDATSKGGSSVYIETRYLPNLDPPRVDLAWTNADYVEVAEMALYSYVRAPAGLIERRSEAPKIMLHLHGGSGPGEDSMHLGSLYIGAGSAGIAREASLGGTLSADGFSVYASFPDLEVPFDRLRWLSVGTWGWGNWSDTVRLTSPRALAGDMGLERLKMDSRTFQSVDARGNKMWAWPKNDMESVFIMGDINANFFSSFPEPGFKVNNSFKALDLYGNLNCGPIDSLRNQTLLPVGGGEDLILPSQHDEPLVKKNNSFYSCFSYQTQPSGVGPRLSMTPWMAAALFALTVFAV